MFKLEAPNNEKKVLLHACCAPCSSAIIECLLQNDIRPTVFYFNPNIFPEEEYLIRKTENQRYTQALGLDFVDADYHHTNWREQIKGLENEPERGSRCVKCFHIRLLETARFASRNDFTLFTTTLASSRWKNLDAIFLAGRYASEQFQGVRFWEQNWRKGGLSERRRQIINEYDFYNQHYCGCEFSFRKTTQKA